MDTRIGTCGYGRAKKPDYASQLDCVEIQHTFYKPPQVKTLEGWRSEMPEGFEFTLKAWQFITHETMGDQLYDWAMDPGESNNLIHAAEGKTAAVDLKSRIENVMRPVK